MGAATGAQFVLTRGDARARVGAVAAVLREFSVAGVNFTETWPENDQTPHGCGIVLVPWPNRIEAGAWLHEGKKLQLDITDVGNNCAIHGLLRNTAYTAVEQSPESVTLHANVFPQHGYPFQLDTSVTYSLSDQGLQVTHRLRNEGAAPAPFGVGAHPYLRVGAYDTADLTVVVDAASYLPLNERKVPLGAQPVSGTEWDLRPGKSLASIDLDTAYTDLTPVDGRQQVTLGAPDGSGILLWADKIFGYIQVFTPRDFPVRGHAVAVEPMTCPANAFNSGNGLLWLEPGASFEASWGLAPFGF
ncbi:aldose epimerase [Nakamurella antarctica]|uniref:Aldose epimerase n=1 Tax=Nakamurella antarctica TaxID=1902245 RepID=A0A3G8ZIU1_9ACTN|nr:aldose 1-epimerase family protein [Nakamurella antarctica]AZI57279.1 aldose epimerase [Nakamurella antarctica]